MSCGGYVRQLVPGRACRASEQGYGQSLMMKGMNANLENDAVIKMIVLALVNLGHLRFIVCRVPAFQASLLPPENSP